MRNNKRYFKFAILTFDPQGILKKTNYTRSSLHGRSVKYSSDTPDGKQAMVQKPVDDNVKRSKDYKNELNQQLSKASKTELLPGVMLEGSSYDL